MSLLEKAIELGLEDGCHVLSGGGGIVVIGMISDVVLLEKAGVMMTDGSGEPEPKLQTLGVNLWIVQYFQ